MKFRITVFSTNNTIIANLVEEFDNQDLANAYSKGVFDALMLTDNYPTEVTTVYIQD